MVGVCFLSDFPMLFTRWAQRNIGRKGSEGMVGMERGAWCLGMKGQTNYFNTTEPQNSDKIDMKVLGFIHCFYIHKISLLPL